MALRSYWHLCFNILERFDPFVQLDLTAWWCLSLPSDKFSLLRWIIAFLFHWATIAWRMLLPRRFIWFYCCVILDNLWTCRVELRLHPSQSLKLLLCVHSRRPYGRVIFAYKPQTVLIGGPSHNGQCRIRVGLLCANCNWQFVALLACSLSLSHQRRSNSFIQGDLLVFRVTLANRPMV